MEKTTLVKRDDVTIIDIIETIKQKRLVEVKPTAIYTLAPQSDLVRRLDGSVISLTYTLVDALVNGGAVEGGLAPLL